MVLILQSVEYLPNLLSGIVIFTILRLIPVTPSPTSKMLLKWGCYEMNQVFGLVDSAYILYHWSLEGQGTTRSSSWQPAVVCSRVCWYQLQKTTKGWKKVIASVDTQIMVFFFTLLSFEDYIPLLRKIV